MAPQPAAQTLGDRVRDLIGGFQQDPDLARQCLSDLLSADAKQFCAAALPAIPAISDAGCRRCLLELLMKKGLLPACDPSVFSLEQEIAMARELAQLDSSLDMKLASRFSGAAEPLPDEVAQRALELLAEVAQNSRVLPLVIKLLHDPNPRLRSKAALVIGRSNMAPHTAERLVYEPDPRVRANAIEALWGTDTAKTRVIFRDAAADRNNRVAGNALLGLFRLGDPGVIPRVLGMAAHPEPLFRSTAAWVMERTGNPRFLPALARMVRENHPRARTRVFRAIAALNREAARLAQCPPLRVHILGVSMQADGIRTVRAAIASGSGAEVRGLPFTGIVVSENSRPVTDYTVRKPAPPESIALGLFLPEGSDGDRMVAAVSALKRECDRSSVVRYPAGAPVTALQPLLAALESGGIRRVLIHADRLSAADTAAPGCAAVIAQARACSAQIHSIALCGPAVAYGRTLADQTGGAAIEAGTPEQAVAACEKLYLGMLHRYEIAYRTPDRTAAAAELKLEVYAAEGYGMDLLQPANPNAMAS